MDLPERESTGLEQVAKTVKEVKGEEPLVSIDKELSMALQRHTFRSKVLDMEAKILKAMQNPDQEEVDFPNCSNLFLKQLAIKVSQYYGLEPPSTETLRVFAKKKEDSRIPAVMLSSITLMVPEMEMTKDSILANLAKLKRSDGASSQTLEEREEYSKTGATISNEEIASDSISPVSGELVEEEVRTLEEREEYSKTGATISNEEIASDSVSPVSGELVEEEVRTLEEREEYSETRATISNEEIASDSISPVRGEEVGQDGTGARHRARNLVHYSNRTPPRSRRRNFEHQLTQHQPTIARPQWMPYQPIIAQPQWMPYQPRMQHQPSIAQPQFMQYQPSNAQPQLMQQQYQPYIAQPQMQYQPSIEQPQWMQHGENVSPYMLTPYSEYPMQYPYHGSYSPYYATHSSYVQRPMLQQPMQYQPSISESGLLQPMEQLSGQTTQRPMIVWTQPGYFYPVGKLSGETTQQPMLQSMQPHSFQPEESNEEITQWPSANMAERNSYGILGSSPEMLQDQEAGVPDWRENSERERSKSG